MLRTSTRTTRTTSTRTDKMSRHAEIGWKLKEWQGHRSWLRGLRDEMCLMKCKIMLCSWTEYSIQWKNTFEIVIYFSFSSFHHNNIDYVVIKYILAPVIQTGESCRVLFAISNSRRSPIAKLIMDAYKQVKSHSGDSFVTLQISSLRLLILIKFIKCSHLLEI